MYITYATAPHIVLGFLVLTFYWVPLLTRKGSAVHRRWGQAYFLSLAPIVVSVVPITFFGKGQLAPDAVIQVLYLALCLGTVGITGWRAIRCKTDIARFRNHAFGVLAFAMAAGGGVLLAIGIAVGKGLPVVLSTIGIGYGALMLRFYFMKADPHPKWWLSWHVSAVSLLFSATHGSVMSVVWKSFFGPGTGDTVQIVTQSIGLIGAVTLRFWLGRYYHVPVDFMRGQSKDSSVMPSSVGSLGVPSRSATQEMHTKAREQLAIGR